MSFNVSQYEREKKYDNQAQPARAAQLASYQSEQGINLSEYTRQQEEAERQRRLQEQQKQQNKQEDEQWVKAQAARTASRKRGETGEQWYTNSKSNYDAATKLLEDLKKTKASNAEIEEAAKRLAEAEEDYNYSKYFRFSDISSDKDYESYIEKGKSILNGKSEVGKQISEGTYSPTGSKILDFFYRLNGSTMANGYGGSGSGQAMNAAVAASAQDTTDQVIDEDTWSEDEKNTYLYLLGRDGEASASEYAIEINAGYAQKSRQAQQEKIADWSTKNAMNSVLGTAATIVSAATPIGLGNFFNMAAELAGKGRISQKESLSPVQISSTVQSAIATSLNEKYGTISESAPIVGGKGWGDAYQLANSIMTSWASIGTGGEVGSLMFFFGNAASQGVQDALDRGISPEKAVALGFANGIAEVAGEKFSVENLIHMKSSRTLGQYLKSIATQAGIEGSEEGFTTFLNTIADRFINGDKSEYNQKVDNLMGQGVSYDEAKKQALKEYFSDLAFDILGGAISGGVSAAGGSVIQNMSYNGDSQLLIDTAKQVGSDQDVLRAAEIDKAVAESKNGQLKRGEAGELMGIIEENGGTEALRKNAETKSTLDAVAKELGLNNAQKAVLADGYETGDADAQTYAYGVREAYKLGQMGLSLEQATERAQFASDLNEAQFRHAWQLGAGQKSVTDTDVADVATPEGKERLASALSMLGEHAQAAADAYDGKQDVARFAAAMNKAANLYAANGVDVKALAQELQESGSKDIISYLSEEQLEAAAKIGTQIRAQNEAESKKSSARLTTLREQAAAILAAGGRSTQALNNIDKAIAAASKYGQQEYSLYQEKLAALEEMVKADPEAENTEAYQKAYEEAEEHYQNAVEARKGIDNLEEKRKELQAKQPIKRKKGTVSFEGGTDPNTGKQLKAVDQTKLSKHQKNVVSMVEALADIINIDYVFFNGDSNTGGEYIGDGVIYININSGVTRNFAQGIAAASLSHELTHFMQEYAPEEYNELKDFIVSEIMKKSPSEFDALVKQQLAWQPDLTYAQAVDEVIANSCQNMLLNSQYIAQFAREHMTAAEKVKDTIHDIVSKIKAAYEGIDFKSGQGPFRAVRAVIDQTEAIQTRWDKALEAATKNYNAEQIAGSRQQESDLKAAAQTTGVKYQIYYTKDNQPVAVIDGNILKGVPKDRWVKRVTDVIKTFRPGVPVAGKLIGITRNSAKEYASSKDARFLRRNNESLLEKKYRAAGNIDDVIIATTDYVNEGLDHPRTDDIIDFARGRVYMLIGGEGYTAQVLVGYTKRSKLVFYDLLNIEKSNRITEAGLRSPVARKTGDTEVGKPASGTNVPENGTKVKGKNQVWEAPITQEISSAATSINANKLPILYTNRYARFKEGGTNIDVGGGRFDNVTEYLADKGVKNLVFDPYNRSEETNAATLRFLQDGNRADTATCSNCLNVIKEEAARDNVILETAKAIKPDGEAYFTVYEGNESGVGKVTKAGWQENRKTASYVPEIQKYFDKVTPHGKMIVAEKPKTNLPKATWETTPGKAVKFQMLGPVEETDRLVAVHNKSVSGLRRMLERNGVPFPSIAIKKAGTSHEGFGDVSIVFPRSSIDPEVNRQNRLYSNDAWTPTEPVEEYDVGDMWRFQKKFKNMVGDEIYSGLHGGSYLEESDLERKLQYSRGDVFTAVKDQPMLKYAYLKSIGQEPTMPTTQERLDGFGRYKNEQLLAVFSALTEEEISSLDFNNEEMLQRVADILEDQFESQFDEQKREKLRKHPVYTAEKVNPNSIKDAFKKYRNAGYKIETVPDYYTFDRDMRYNISLEEDPGYKAWIEEQFKDLILGHGIPNGKDLYTSSGNRRSFKARHIPATLENIVAQMQKEQERGIGVMGINLRGAATKAYKNVEEMRADSGKLLGKHISDEVYDSYMKGFYERLHNMSATATKGGGNSWEGLDSTEEILLETLRDAKSKQNMDTLLQREAQWINYSPELAEDLWQLREDVQNMPAPYFEAKPRRIVYPGEALAFILPDNAPSDVLDMLNNRGYNVLTYKAGDEADRLAKLNSVEKAKFQKWNSTEDDTAFEAEGREMAYSMLQAENKALQDAIDGLNELTKKQGTTIEKLQKRLKLTKDPGVRMEDAKRLANKLTKKHSSVADKTRLALELKALGDYVLQNKDIKGDELKQRARSIAAEIVENAETTSDLGGEAETYRSIVADMRGKKLTIDTDFLGELSTADGYDSFRKKNFGNFTLAKRETGEDRDGYATVGSFYMEMQQSWGKAYFPDVANEGEQIQVIASFFDLAKPEIVNPYEQYIGEATEELANEIVFDALEGVMRQIPPTTADRWKTKRDAERARANTAEREAMRAGERAAETIDDLTMQLDEAESHEKSMLESIRELERQGELSEKEAQRMAATIYDLSIQLDNARSRYKTLQKEAAYRTQQVQAEGRVRQAEIRAEEKAKANKKIKAVADRYRDMAQRAKERREENAGATKYRKKIQQQAKKLSDWLMKNSDKEHVPEALKAPLLDFLTSIDFTSKRALNGGEETQADIKFGARLLKLQQMLANQQSYLDGNGEVQGDLGGYIDVSPDMLQFLRDMAQQVTDTMNAGGDFTINRMTADQLRDLSNLLAGLTTSIRNMNAFMANARYESVREAASQDIDQMNKLGKVVEKESGVLRRLFKWENGTPYYVFKRFGKGGVSIFEGLTKGWDKMAFNVQEIIDFTEKLYTSKEVNEWKSTVHDITLEDGSEIQMTTAQLMELSMLLNREQALKHIENGGIRIGDIQTKKGKLTDVNHYHLTGNDIGNMLKLLTGRQMDVAKQLQTFMATKGAEWGNEISMRRFGYNFYTEGENYFPIKTDANDRPMADTDAQQNSMFRLLNLSSSKSLNPRASNALVVNDIFDTFSDHMADQAKLNGLGLPILDAIKWFNYKERIDLEEGGYDTRTLQAAMEHAFGSDAQKYFRTLMKDVNGLTESGDRGKEIYSKMTSNYKVAAVAANLRVALLQPTSYVRASFLIDPKYLAAAFLQKNAYKEAMKYSGTAVWKSLGYFDTNIARNMRDQIQHNDIWKDNVVEKTMMGAELGDKLTWGRLWVACKMQTQAQNKGLTGEELNQKTADLFREVVYSSQVMDSTLTRSSLMRSSSAFNKMLTPFMAEPTLSYNILLDAFTSYQLDERSAGKGEAWARNGKKIGKAFAVYTASAAFSALAESLWDAVRDTDDDAFIEKFLDALLGDKDDEDDENDTAKDTFFKFLLGKKALGGRKWLSGNLWQDISILQKLPYIKNVISLFQGYSNADMLTSGFNLIKQEWEIFNESLSLNMGYLDKATKTTYYGKMTPWGKIYKGVQGLSQLTGLPIYATLRDSFAIWNTIVGSTHPEWKVRTYDGNQMSQSKKNAYKEFIKDTGISEKQYQKILTAADADGNGKIKQVELDEYMKSEIAAGNMTEDQASAIWESLRGSNNWAKTYDQYKEEQKPKSTPAPAATTKPAATSKPQVKIQTKITTYEDFKKSVKLYSDKKDTAYQLWESTVRPTGIDLDTYTKLLNSSDTNGNNSVTQDELGVTLTKAIQKGELTDDQAGAIWYTLWNDRRSKTYASWAARNGYRDSGTHEAWLNLQEINEARGDNYIFEGAPVTQEEYDQDYLSRGYYPNRTGEVRVLEEWDPMRDRNEALDNAFMYFGEGNSAAPELFEEAFIDWYENPDYEGQTFDNYLSNYGDMTPAARRIFSGTGQKAVRREALDYAFWEAVGTGRGRK